MGAASLGSRRGPVPKRLELPEGVALGGGARGKGLPAERGGHGRCRPGRVWPTARVWFKGLGTRLKPVPECLLALRKTGTRGWTGTLPPPPPVSARGAPAPTCVHSSFKYSRLPLLGSTRSSRQPAISDDVDLDTRQRGGHRRCLRARLCGCSRRRQRSSGLTSS